MQTLTASKIMTKNPLTVYDNETIEQTIKLMDKKKITSMPVINKNKNFLGLITEDDLALHELNPHAPAAMTILGSVIYLEDTNEFNTGLKKILAYKTKDIMNKDIITLKENSTLFEIITIMHEQNQKSIPVLKGKKLIGIISRTNVLHALAKKI
ncbi:hypothetical protein A2483_02185 [Candidatus Peregrinibacteria bacterium RIFOXYC2_FULL_33_13]|nr:MAG: CBS domain containing membrane protein [Candidatus Peregrinibacteria bacterium GW2011_GWA2_33_10]KKP40903.1 MAG: hypothetical protein UR30_C0003G0075 [Candidatus Peregrinibacteria bacterium GW2011_GWC2_33_13]OGJ50155.1 MAG: hypothetical protein A2229_00310 [Candidatus Peregrinibacteria bacterium RIFOXYA2_FULL_33_7]OGJ54839.1 MAG: hypothetical protein A2483_02185 [Candidatus Peregrinibacteria bacterium RIFOXYC2_FULL_33_13]